MDGVQKTDPEGETDDRGRIVRHAPAARATRPATDLELGTADFERVRRLLHAQAGITLSSSRRAMVCNRLSRSVRELDCVDFDDYLTRVETGDVAQKQAFTNALTTNLTSFFREAHHFATLTEQLHRARARRPLAVWCAAASTGEEPYSIAMSAIEAFGGDASPPVRIVASDVDTDVLAVARAGIYGAERVEALALPRLRQFFQRGTGSQDGKVRIHESVRELVDFRVVNLRNARWPIAGPFDAIFCRNVMIYFDESTQRGVLQKFVPLLKPDGLLYVGHSESLHRAADLFTLRSRTVYRLAQPGGRSSDERGPAVDGLPEHR